MHSIHYGGTSFALIGKGQIGLLDNKGAVQMLRDRMRQHVRESTGWETWDETWSETETFRILDVMAMEMNEPQLIPIPCPREEAEYFEMRLKAVKNR